MAEDSRPPPEAQPGPMPRRVPGANAGPTLPPKARRGWMPRRALGDNATRSRPPASRPTPPPEVRPGSPLPRRVPGANAVRLAPRPLLPEHLAGAGSASKDIEAASRAAEASRPAETAAAADAGPQRAVAGPERERSARGQGRGRNVRSARRWRLAGVLTAILLILAAGTVVTALSRHKATAAREASHSAADGGPRIAAEAADRRQAVAWVAGQVNRDDIVACDEVMCAALAALGFPAGNLLVLTPTSPIPFGSDVLIATADIRSQFGSQLESAFAPEVIASFGTGNARIDIRPIAQDGAAAYRAALSADLLARKAAGAQLLRNRRIMLSATARLQLSAGQVDSRLLSTITFLAAQRPIDIVDFGSFAPGASAGIPLRFADLAETDAAARMVSSRYVRSMLALLGSQRLLYRPMTAMTVRLSGGQAVLRIEFAAPSPLGLLPR
jgi:hypothetical protein